MTTTPSSMEKKSNRFPDEIRTFDKGKLELTTFKNEFYYGWSDNLSQVGVGINVLNPLLKQIVVKLLILSI